MDLPGAATLTLYSHYKTSSSSTLSHEKGLITYRYSTSFMPFASSTPPLQNALKDAPTKRPFRDKPSKHPCNRTTLRPIYRIYGACLETLRPNSLFVESIISSKIVIQPTLFIHFSHTPSYYVQSSSQSLSLPMSLATTISR